MKLEGKEEDSISYIIYGRAVLRRECLMKMQASMSDICRRLIPLEPRLPIVTDSGARGPSLQYPWLVVREIEAARDES